MGLAGDDAYTLEAKSGVPQPTTQRFLSGKHGEPRSATVKKWATAYGLKESHLRGDEELPSGEIKILLQHAYGSGKTGRSLDFFNELMKHVREEEITPNSDVIDVPVFNAVGSMGEGSDLVVQEEVIERMTLTGDWLRKTLPGVSANNLSIISGKGNSMFPTFNDGDLLLIDTSISAVDIDGVYVLSAHNRLYIKSVRQRFDGVYEISSDNPSVKTVDVLNGDNPVTVHGRVMFAWNGKKL